MLQHLTLHLCVDLKELPESIGHLNSLNELDLSESGINYLPESIGNLKVLKVLNIGRTLVRKLPNTIGGMKNLEELHARETGLEEIPREIQMLLSLRILDLSSTKTRELPSISKLISLRTLLLEDCLQLHSLPKLPTSLITLHVRCLSLHRFPNFSKCDQLTDLRLHDGTFNILPGKSSLIWIGKLTKLVTLELCLSSIANVTTDFHACSQLKVLVIGFPNLKYLAPQLPPTLTHLCLKFVDLKAKPPCLSHLKELSYLELQHCLTENGLASLGIGELESLRHFRLQCCDFRELEDLSLPKILEELFIDKCKFLKSLSDLSRLQKLRSLVLLECEEIKEIFGLRKIPTLSDLDIRHCKSLEKIDDGSSLRLVRFHFTGCERLRHHPIAQRYIFLMETLKLDMEGYRRRQDRQKGRGDSF